jgi:glycosyltransferase involved in cell wall biosynthesis
MAAGAPVVVSDAVAIGRDVARAGAGVVTARNPESIADALANVLLDRERRAMGARGRRFAVDAYGSRAVARMLVDTYNGLLN